MNFKQVLNNIKAFAFDVDGVLTDGSVVLMPSGDQVRTLNIKDCFALQLAVKKGYKVAIITGGSSELVKERLLKLGISDVYLKASHKMDAFDDFLMLHDLKAENVLYMGDDVPDYEVMKRAGLAACPADAATEIKEISLYISPKNGGEGCVRDLIEQVMRLQGKWEITGW
jgi:3-deoxy-D-manno-octulosonate 8-phosphate phosphatase (KDO 8-P phosphatase)